MVLLRSISVEKNWVTRIRKNYRTIRPFPGKRVSETNHMHCTYLLTMLHDVVQPTSVEKLKLKSENSSSRWRRCRRSTVSKTQGRGRTYGRRRITDYADLVMSSTGPPPVESGCAHSGQEGTADERVDYDDDDSTRAQLLSKKKQRTDGS